MAIYNSCADYIYNATTLKERIDRIDGIIEALELAAAKAAEGEYLEEYNLDDGQSKIKTIYRSAKSAEAAIEAFDRLRNRLVAKLCGTRVMNLRDAKAIRNYGRIW